MDMNLNKQQMGMVFEEVANYFSLLCEPTRLKILHALCNGERTVGDIVEQVESTQANVSRQINMLYRAKILARRKDGTQVYYWIHDDKTMELCKSVCGRVTALVLDQTVAGKRGNVSSKQQKRPNPKG